MGLCPWQTAFLAALGQSVCPVGVDGEPSQWLAEEAECILMRCDIRGAAVGPHTAMWLAVPRSLPAFCPQSACWCPQPAPSAAAAAVQCEAGGCPGWLRDLLSSFSLPAVGGKEGVCVENKGLRKGGACLSARLTQVAVEMTPRGSCMPDISSMGLASFLLL